MVRTVSDIHDYEVRGLIQKLVAFLGYREVKNSLQKYQNSLTSSGPVFREYYLMIRHPWWSAFTIFFELEKAGKSIQKHLTTELKFLAADAKQICILQRLMPESVREKYRKDLLDESRAYDYLFEIHIAWHFFLKGYLINWHESTTKPSSEFLVKTPDFEFNVECKRISMDAFRAVRRRDFYRFAEKLIPKVEACHYSGKINISLKDRLHANEEFLEDLINHIMKVIVSKQMTGSFEIPHGNVCLDLRAADGIQIDLNTYLQEMLSRKPPQAHGAVFARVKKNNKGCNPIELILMSNKGENVLDKLKDKIHEAAKRQLDNSIPGLIVCFFEGVEELSGLASGSGLQIITNLLFLKKELSHLVAIAYCAEPHVEVFGNAERFSNQGLIFHNENCRFERAKGFQFLRGETESP